MGRLLHFDTAIRGLGGAAARPGVCGPAQALMGGLLHLVQRGGAWAAQAPPRCTKCNNPPINAQCTNFVLFDVAL